MLSHDKWLSMYACNLHHHFPSCHSWITDTFSHTAQCKGIFTVHCTLNCAYSSYEYAHAYKHQTAGETLQLWQTVEYFNACTQQCQQGLTNICIKAGECKNKPKISQFWASSALIGSCLKSELFLISERVIWMC